MKAIIFSNNNAPREIVDTGASTVSEFLSGQEVDQNGIGIVLNGTVVDSGATLNDGDRLTVSRSSKGA
jgi:sulfur carrier protein ThiS|tara:strand:+ start:446 stop:649 length:204 start_codon:yes stop_codon:yes gene_type:complete